MQMQHLFFVVGIIFLFASVSYFSYQYVFSLSKEIKTAILALLVVAFFFGGELMKEKGM
ncbi:hypothetical protein HY640_03570 [Candidatus Woesearchaeota archaeon]|nr:hypothetical protein [Candidatus Woesearchaeota archaeon]